MSHNDIALIGSESQPMIQFECVEVIGDLETGPSLPFRLQPFKPRCRPLPRLPRERFRSHVDSSRPVSANSGHSLTLWRKGQIDPSPRFKIVPVNSREARESGLSTKPSYFPMLQVIRLLVLDGSAGIVTTLLIRVWWAVGGTSGVE